MKLDPAIRRELYLALLLQGAEPMVLATVAAWGDALDDADVLRDLRNWNEAKALELQEWLPTLTEHEREAVEARLREFGEARQAAVNPAAARP
ncbi:MAG TPA: hypothetical protein VFB08_01990 [Burkholderiales bacterium]|nr:hypothetical protein [Burkholderiales bacterium]